MLHLILKSHLAFVLIPLFTLAIEPSNPTLHCERFLSDSEKASCVQKVEAVPLDWYASSACALQEDDKNFLICLDEIKNADFNPEALDLCARAQEISDEGRLACLRKIKNREYTRAQIKTCSEGKGSEKIANCLVTNSSIRDRVPASKTSRPGFQPLEIRR